MPGSPRIDGGRVYFTGGSQDAAGIFEWEDGTIRLLFRDDETVPGSVGEIGFISRYAVSDSRLVIYAVDEPIEERGIFVVENGIANKLVDSSDTLDDVPVASVRMHQQGVSGNQIAFQAYLEDDTTAVYLATLPPRCNDSVDNDGDGLADDEDPGCRDADDDSEDVIEGIEADMGPLPRGQPDPTPQLAARGRRPARLRDLRRGRRRADQSGLRARRRAFLPGT